MVTKEVQEEILRDLSMCLKFLAKHKKGRYLKAVRILMQDNITLQRQINLTKKDNEDE